MTIDDLFDSFMDRVEQMNLTIDGFKVLLSIMGPLATNRSLSGSRQLRWTKFQIDTYARLYGLPSKEDLRSSTATPATAATINVAARPDATSGLTTESRDRSPSRAGWRLRRRRSSLF